MDGSSFDTFARRAAADASRRGMLKAAFAAVAGLGAGAGEAEAKKRKPRRRKCGPCQRRKKGKCKPQATGTLCAGGFCQGGVCNPSFCAGKDHCIETTFCNQPGSAITCNCFVTAGSRIPFCGQQGYSGSSGCDDCEPGDACVKCGDSAICQKPCAAPL